MQRGWWSTADRVGAPLGHVLLLTAFILPWVVGDFGARDSFTGVDLARVASGAAGVDGAEWHGISRAAEVILLAIPLLAANALLLHGLAFVTPAAHDGARRVARWLAEAQALALLVVVVMLVVASGELTMRPGVGLVLACIACAVTLAPAFLVRTPRVHLRSHALEEASEPSV